MFRDAFGLLDRARKKCELEKQLAALLVAATGCDLARELQAKIGRARDQLLTFCDYPGEVDVTNNASERKLRPCVIQRKVTNGYRAMWGRPGRSGRAHHHRHLAARQQKSLQRHRRHLGLSPAQAGSLDAPRVGGG